MKKGGLCPECKRKAREGTWDWICTRKDCSVFVMLKRLEKLRREGKLSRSNPALLIVATDYGVFTLKDDGTGRTIEGIGLSETEENPTDAGTEAGA